MPASQPSTPPPPRPVRQRRPWPLWGLALLFLAAAVSVPMAMHFRRQQQLARMPRNLTELAERIQEKHPEWRIVTLAGSPDNYEFGFLVCDHADVNPDIIHLSCTSEHAPKWKGIVRCHNDGFVVADNDWGEYGVRIGRFSLFGDREMFTEIASLLR